MAWEDVPQGPWRSTSRRWTPSSAAGTDRRVAEGRARSKAIRAYHDANPDAAEAHPARPAAVAAAGGDGAGAAAAAPAAVRRRGSPAAAAARSRGGRDGRRRRGAAPATVPRPRCAAAHRRHPDPKKGAPEKHRLLALVPPEGIQRVERRAGRPRQRVAAPVARGVHRDAHPVRRARSSSRRS